MPWLNSHSRLGDWSQLPNSQRKVSVSAIDFKCYWTGNGACRHYCIAICQIEASRTSGRLNPFMLYIPAYAHTRARALGTYANMYTTKHTRIHTNTLTCYLLTGQQPIQNTRMTRLSVCLSEIALHATPTARKSACPIGSIYRVQSASLLYGFFSSIIWRVRRTANYEFALP